MPRAGQLVFGAASLAYGVVALEAHHTLIGLLKVAGGAAILIPFTAGIGAVLLVAAYLIAAVLLVPPIFATPLVYNPWGNVFEQISLLAGAIMVFAGFSSAVKPRAVQRFGRIAIGLCSASFGLEQAFYLSQTASLVPKWIPPSQMFWADATTIAFLIAAVALIVNRAPLLASRLLTAMIVLFGLIVWLPLIASAPHDLGNWSEGAETFAIAGATWILADLLGGRSARRA